MDFIRVAHKEKSDGTREFYPSLQALESQDLVIRGGQFVAIWDEDTGLYSRRLSHVPEIIDRAFARMVGERLRPGDTIRKVRVFDNQIYSRLMGLIRNIGDMGPELDQRLVFANETPKKEHAASFRLPYSLSDAQCPVWDEIVGTLYEPEERIKIEWAIGSIFAGASLDIQKFYVFFGPPGSGKSTIMNIIERLFDGHTAHFSAYEMGRADSQFSLEPFAKNPLVAVDQDGDLSRIEVNKNMNSIVSHDRVLINSKGKSLYTIKPRAVLFIGSNEPVKISNRKSGLFRRLVDIQPSGNLIPEEEYHKLMTSVMFELGAIANHCRAVFEEYGPTYLSSYRSNDMMYRTNDIFNFVQDNRLILQKGISLKQAHKLYTEWCNETDTRNVYKQYQFRDLLADYFTEFHQQVMVDGYRHRSYFMGLRELEKFTWKGLVPKGPLGWLEMEDQESRLDVALADMPAQYSTGDDQHPLKQAWAKVTTKLSDLDTSKEHYVKTPTQMIQIDFDLKDDHGRKDLQRNLDAASHWPPTYAEVSRGGSGLHLTYIYDGDVERLASGDDLGSFEVKTLLGNSSLRRRLTVCNNLPIASISSGLPMKEEKVLSPTVMANEKGLRALILRGLRKEIHQYTKPSMDFIAKVLDDAQAQGMPYDVSDMWDDIIAFAMSSSNQKNACIEIAMGLKLKSEADVAPDSDGASEESPVVYFDCEVYPNLFAIGWKYGGRDEVVKMVNPTPEEVEELLELRLVGYNNRMYDNHILWARTLGYDNEALFRLSQRIVVENDRRATFGAAYNVAYADIYDYASEKKSLKKWMIELGIPHKEMDLPWDEPVPEDRVLDVLSYLENDVRATEAVAEARRSDFAARQILADLSGLAVCNTTRQHTERLIFGTDNDVQEHLVYTDLSEMFPGYKFNQFAPGKEKSIYKDVRVGEGGYVYSKPGIYENVALLDVASMHPTSIVELNLFGKYTQNFKNLLDIRLLIKRGDYDTAIDLDERLKPYLTDKSVAKSLSDALKIVINSVYGLTAATFPNKFKDPQNVDNIVAKRGALFMVDLKEFIEEKGFEVVHIKTDSVKIREATPEIIEEVFEFGSRYGYVFEHEETYRKLCLVNDAVFVAQTTATDVDHGWKAVGTQFLHPVVFKTLFSKEPITNDDYVEVKQVAKGNMYLVTEVSDVRQFVGRFGAFVPVLEGRRLLRVDGDKEGAVTGTKDYLWETSENAFGSGLSVDMSYFQNLVEEGIRTIEKFGSYSDLIK